MIFLKSKWILVLGGAVLGFAYYYFIGCTSGSCPIQSNPVGSTVYGGLLGLAISSAFRSADKRPDE